MLQLYQDLQIDMSEERTRWLLDLTNTQMTRTYTVSDLSDEDIAGFDEFTNLVKSSQQEGLRDVGRNL